MPELEGFLPALDTLDHATRLALFEAGAEVLECRRVLIRGGLNVVGEILRGQDAFWAVFDICMNNPPEHIARVYTMRELLELETAEICAELGITSNNCFVILHRARLGLRECLENRWLQGESR